MYKEKFCGGGKERRVIWKFCVHTGYFGGTRNGRIHTSWFGELWCLRAEDIVVVCWASLFSLFSAFSASPGLRLLMRLRIEKKSGVRRKEKRWTSCGILFFFFFFQELCPPPPPPSIFWAVIKGGKIFSRGGSFLWSDGVFRYTAEVQGVWEDCVFGGAVDSRRCHLSQVLLPMQPLQGHT